MGTSPCFTNSSGYTMSLRQQGSHTAMNTKAKIDAERRELADKRAELDDPLTLRLAKPGDCEEVISIDQTGKGIKLVYRTAGNDIVIKTYTVVENTAKMSEWMAERNKKKE